jgi:predicted nucleic acid-binding protein
LKIYADASFLISLYTLDANSAIAGQTMRASDGERYVTVFGELEVVNALQLRVFRKELSESQIKSSLADFEKDMRDGILLLRPLPDQVFERAGELSRQPTARLGTRTADLLHVAAALELSADYLYSFDQQQRRIARAVGLKVN